MMGAPRKYEWNQRVLDDLDEQQSRIRLETGDLLMQGTYEGILRDSDGEWFLCMIVKDEGRYVPVLTSTKDITHIRKLPKK